MFQNVTDYKVIPPSKKPLCFLLVGFIVAGFSALLALCCGISAFGEVMKDFTVFFIVAAVLALLVALYAVVMYRRQRVEDAKPGQILYTFREEGFTYLCREEGKQDDVTEFTYEDLLSVKESENLLFLKVRYNGSPCTITLDMNGFSGEEERVAFREFIRGKTA